MMAPFDFPSSPSIGQIFNNQWRYDGEKWGGYEPTRKPTARQNNLIVNPTGQVSQENGVTLGSTTGYYASDQWAQFYSGVVTSFQLVSAQTPNRSIYRLRQIVTTNKATLTGTEFCGIMQVLEGVNTAGLGWGTANAYPIVLRFGVKLPAGTYSVNLRNAALDRSYVKSFTISAGQANIETEFVLAIPGDTAGSWSAGTGASVYFGIFPACGPTYQTATDGAWIAGDFRGITGQTNFAATNGNTFDLFDVGMHADPDGTTLAPPWQAPVYAEELAKCQRYYEPLNMTDLFIMTRLSGGQGAATWWFNAPKRTAPTVTFTTSGSGVSAYMPVVNGVEFLQTTVSSAAITSAKAVARFV